MFSQELVKKKVINYMDAFQTKLNEVRDYLERENIIEYKNAENSSPSSPETRNKNINKASESEDQHKREQLQKNFENNEQEGLEAIEEARQTSMLNSQGVSDHSGSGYQGPGKPLQGKVNSNMSQRNFDNHQSNRS